MNASSNDQMRNVWTDKQMIYQLDTEIINHLWSVKMKIKQIIANKQNDEQFYQTRLNCSYN